jgi:hypothetical protein
MWSAWIGCISTRTCRSCRCRARSSRCELLAAVLDRAIACDAAPVSVVQRDWFAVREDEPAAEVIARFAAAGTALFARVAPLYDVIRSASALPEVERLLADIRRRRRADQRHIVRALAAAGNCTPTSTPTTLLTSSTA